MSITKNISNGKHISRATMYSLLEGNLNAKDRMAVTAHLESCELCRDACNGLKQMPDLKALATLNNKWKTVSSKHKLKKIEINLNTFYIIFTFALIIIISLIFLFFFNHSTQKQQVGKQTLQNNSVKKTTYSNQPESFITVNNIVDSASIPVNQEVDLKSTAISKHDNQPGIDPIKIKEPSEMSSPVHAKPVEYIYGNIKTKAIRNLIIIDYTTEYTKEKDARTNMNNGLAARYSNKTIADSLEKSNSQTSFHTTYEGVLDNAFVNLSAKKYDKSIEDLKFILQYFPDDLNCTFYIGFSLENNLKFKEALPYFTQIINSQNPVFGDAARYHSALCHIELHNIAEAEILLNELIETKSFYATQAKEKLSQLK